MRDIDVLAVGELNPDLVLRGDVTPAFGQIEQILEDASLTIGSSAGIFACGAARLGLRVAFAGKVGNDEFGRFMQNSLTERGIDTSGVVVDPEIKTGLTVILSRGNDRAILTYVGTISRLRYSEIDLSLLDRARHLHLASYFMMDDLRPDIPRLFTQAKQRGLSISLDTNYDPNELWDGGLAEALSHTDIFFPNQTELHAISGIPDTELALKAMAERVPTVAVKLGEQGGIARRGLEVVQCEPLRVKVIDTTGAGDSFDAGFLYGYLSGWDLARSLRMACTCGSISTTASGGTSSQPSLDEALQVM